MYGIIVRSLFMGLSVSSMAWADTQNLKQRQVYMGHELLNESATGNSCFITIQDVRPNFQKGMHCYTVDFLYSSVRTDVPKDTLTVDARITNYHRPEFPKTRTCAMNVNGTTSGNEIYGEDTSILYNQIFGGENKASGTQFDYFLTLAPDTKIAVRARVHITEAFEEKDIDCINLEKM